MIGSVLAFAFWRLDIRTRELIKAAEQPLRELQGRLARRVALPGLELSHVVERPSKAFASYSWVIRAVAVTAGVTFAVGAVYAFWFAS